MAFYRLQELHNMETWVIIFYYAWKKVNTWVVVRNKEI